VTRWGNTCPLQTTDTFPVAHPADSPQPNTPGTREPLQETVNFPTNPARTFPGVFPIRPTACSDSASRPVAFRDPRFGVTMTRDEWSACGDSVRVLDFLRDRATDRKLWLFARAWGRDVWRHLSDERSREVILAADRPPSSRSAPPRAGTA
jgi:hypothetical protein